MNAFSIGIILSLVDKLSSPLRAVNQSVDRLTNSMNNLSRAGDKFSRSFEAVKRVVEKAKAPFDNLRNTAEEIKDISTRMALKGSAGFMLGIAPSVDAAEFEKAIAEVATLTDMSVQEFNEKYGKQVLKLSVELGENPVVVAKALYQAISAGLSADESIEFLKKQGKAAIAGVSDIFTSVDLATSIKNAFGLSIKEIDRVNDIIFFTVKKGKTTFPEIARNFGQIAAAAGSAGISLEHLQTAVAQLTLGGVKTEQAYTSLKYTIEALVSPAGKAKKIFQELGLEINAETLREKDLLGVMDELMQALEKLPEAQRQALIGDIFGSMEAQVFVKDFMVRRNEYLQTLKEMLKASGIAEEAYQKMAKTTAKEFDRMKESFKVLRITLGSTLLPAINLVLQTFLSLIRPVSEFAQRHKTLTSVVLGSFIAFTGLTALLGFLGIGVSMLINGFINFRVAITLLATGIKLFSMSAITAIRAVSIALLTTPLGLIITAITALIVAGYLLYKNWDTVSKYISKALNFIRASFVNVFNKIVSFISKIDLFEAGKKIILTIWNGMKSLASKPVELIKQIVQRIRNLLPFSPAKEGPLRDIHKIKLIETIAEKIKPTPILNRMREALNIAIAPAVKPFTPTPAPAGSSIVINYNPTINISSASAPKDDILRALRQHQHELLKLIQDAQAKADRRRY